ncbi:hypothetical protein ACVRXQ_13340 [Streptococcus panodentis]|uniref:Integral membrane protein n=1 Tax=Streptococcus panodentis TaxID=1581472 RepID=A0ABS5AXH8_9STRE|nr:hypothetical protein [Streptococcus panodentis]MBP2621279.1 hypothetical protein [Streptococcus panodentis]
MQTKSIVLTSGLVGLIGGIFLLLGPILIFTVLGSSFLFTILKIAILALGIASLVYYKGDQRVGVAGPVLLIIAGIVALIPLLGWLGGILAIVGGALYLANLKKFTV